MNIPSPCRWVFVGASVAGAFAIVWWIVAALPAPSNGGCVPTPRWDPPDNGTARTATPSVFATEASVGAKNLPGPSTTPLPINRVIDMAKDSAEADKAQLYVYRCDGTIDLYLIRSGAMNVPSVLALGPNDIVLNSVPPASSMGHYPPRSDSTEIPMPAAGGDAGDGYPSDGITPGSPDSSPPVDSYPEDP